MVSPATHLAINRCRKTRTPNDAVDRIFAASVREHREQLDAHREQLDVARDICKAQEDAINIFEFIAETERW